MAKLADTIVTIVEDINAGNTSIDAIANESLALINKTQKDVNDYISIIDEAQLKNVVLEQANSNGQLKGVPISLKDNIMTKDFAVTCASKMLENFEHPLINATVVDKLINAGAVIMGKTNLDEFAMGSNGETSYFGPTRNPYNYECVTGGSSSGSAASVATGGVKASLGTDTGGSVRQPASFTNNVGMKPTYGRISRFGVTGFASSLDQVGIITKTVADNARVLSAIAGLDPLDTTSSREPMKQYDENLAISLKGKRIAILKENIDATAHEEIKELIDDAIKVYESLGATVEKISLPNLQYVVPTYYVISSCEASSNLGRFDGLHYGFRAEGYTDADDIMKHTRAQGFGKEVKKRIALGTHFLSLAAYEKHFLKAAKMRRIITDDYLKVFDSFDIIMGPTTPILPKKIGEQTEKNADYLNDLCTIPANLAGLPAISVPAGFTKAGLPVGMQLVGAPFAEELLYQMAYAFEQETEYYKVKPVHLRETEGGANNE